MKTKNLNVKGFGIFSDSKIPELECKILREGRYINHRFIYSEESTITALNDLIKCSDIKHINIADTAFLISKIVDLSASSKYGYLMELQIMQNI